ncbi:hypothetical protein V7S43_007306 [Phytophthora oleae]|uniref:Uncharacterized protein n=1 Tax=Phytophthora oleae TaxID=2107226 RepID=A0ABD3FLY4_9STRA
MSSFEDRGIDAGSNEDMATFLPLTQTLIAPSATQTLSPALSDASSASQDPPVARQLPKGRGKRDKKLTSDAQPAFAWTPKAAETLRLRFCSTRHSFQGTHSAKQLAASWTD